MIAEIGHFALILALCLALVQSTLPLLGAAWGKPGWMAVARRAAWGQFFFIAIAFGALTNAFISNDFSLVYVATNSNSALPLAYRISAVWGAHEGSLLLWTLLLSMWTVAVAAFSRSLPQDTVARVIAVMGMISIGFLLFMLLTSNPFERIPLAMIPANGRDLNPLLQDPGLVLHPPMLYMGYVGFSVAFAFAVAALIGGHLDAAWARWSRPWTAVAWLFLTIGIALGSWWAYYELGWGGWWFWDPVENASFMPWLVGTALIHSLATTEKRGVFKSWTVLLAILAFSLSLLGAFIVRSGVLVSVHAFATDPERGVFILIFLCIAVGGSLALYAWRSATVSSSGRFDWLSRETALLMNNVIFVTAAVAVFVGTMYPLLLDALGMGKISVGRPYFDTMFAWIAVPLLLLLGFGPTLRWKSDRPDRALRRLRLAFGFSLAAGMVLPLMLDGVLHVTAGLGLAGALWVGLTSIMSYIERARSASKVPLAFKGMVMAHLGVALFVAGVTMVMTYSQEKDLRMAPGASYELAGYTFRFNGVTKVQGPNYTADEASIDVLQGGEIISTLKPQKRIYVGQPNNAMTEASIDVGFMRDVYAAMGEPLDNGAWSLRLYYRPLIRWIWLGTLLMTIGGVLAVCDRRYRARKTASQANRRAAGAMAG